LNRTARAKNESKPSRTSMTVNRTRIRERGGGPGNCNPRWGGERPVGLREGKTLKIARPATSDVRTQRTTNKTLSQTLDAEKTNTQIEEKIDISGPPEKGGRREVPPAVRRRVVRN